MILRRWVQTVKRDLVIYYIALVVTVSLVLLIAQVC